MKILLLAPVHFEIDFIKQKGNLPFPEKQAHLGWFEALKELGNDTKVFRYSDSVLIPNIPRIYVSSIFGKFFPIWKARLGRLSSRLNLFYFENLARSKKLEEISGKFRPNLIIISGGSYGLSQEVLLKIKNNTKCKAVLLSGVNPIYGASKLDLELIRNGFFDFIFVNDAGYAKNWEKLGAKSVIVLPLSGANPKIHKKIKLSKEETDKYESDICFVGSISSYRQKILKQLKQFNLKIWGYIPLGDKLDDDLKENFYGGAYDREMVKIYNAAKIGLNIHEKDMKYGGNLKTFEIPACGTFELIDNVDKSWFKLGQEIVVFKNIADLKKKIEYYLTHDNERSRIAKAGQARVAKDHLHVDHFKKLIKYVS